MLKFLHDALSQVPMMEICLGEKSWTGQHTLPQTILLLLGNFSCTPVDRLPTIHLQSLVVQFCPKERPARIAAELVRKCLACPQPKCCPTYPCG
jgi:hypothetical protein